MDDQSAVVTSDYDLIFADLDPLVADDYSAAKELSELAKEMRDEVATSVDDNPNISAGYTYLGQIIIHDLTSFSMASTNFSAPYGKKPAKNLRSPTLDLDCVYGQGPDAQPIFYEDPESRNDRSRYLLRSGSAAKPLLGEYDRTKVGCPYDLPRLINDTSGVLENEKKTTADPLIPDPRNDDHLIISQLHLIFVRLHNRVARILVSGQFKDKFSPQDVFELSQAFVIHCYHDVIRFDFLEKILCSDVYTDFLRDDPKFLCLPEDSPIMRNSDRLPIEFSLAAGRFGHSMVRNKYHFNKFLGLSNGNLNQLMRISGFEHFRDRGKKMFPLPANWIVEWDRFFEFGSAPVIPSRRISPFISSQLSIEKPKLRSGHSRTLISLDLLRSTQARLPSGQKFAERLSEHCLGHMDVSELSPREMRPDSFAHGQTPERNRRLLRVLGKHPKLLSNTPLFYYILQESAVRCEGLRLGPVGSFIVGLTFRLVLGSTPVGYRKVVESMSGLVQLADGPDEALIESVREFVDRPHRYS